MMRAVVNGRDFRFLYDANNERIAAVERVTGTDGITRNKTTYTVRGITDQLLSVGSTDAISGAFTFKEDEIWREGALLARETASGTKHFTLDHLGSPRAIATPVNGLTVARQEFAPFGSG